MIVDANVLESFQGRDYDEWSIMVLQDVADGYPLKSLP